MARSEEESFAWPGRNRSTDIERAAAQAADRGLERLRERQRRRRPAPPPPPSPVLPPAEPEPPAAPATEPEPREPMAPDLWNAQFDQLAEDLITELHRDLGPKRDDG